MGADACHHAGILRPSEYLPLPRTISPSPIRQFAAAGCPGAVLQQLQPRGRANEPFFALSEGAFPAHRDATETIRKIEELDSLDNVLVVIAHDESLLGEIDLYPDAVNGWMEKRIKARTRWMFCRDLERAID